MVNNRKIDRIISESIYRVILEKKTHGRDETPDEKISRAEQERGNKVNQEDRLSLQHKVEDENLINKTALGRKMGLKGSRNTISGWVDKILKGERPLRHKDLNKANAALDNID
jgi:hypothetical protein